MGFHPKFVSVLDSHEIIKKAYKGKFNPLLYVTPLMRGDDALRNAFGPSSGEPLFDIASLRKALIGNLVIANTCSQSHHSISVPHSTSKVTVCTAGTTTAVS